MAIKVTNSSAINASNKLSGNQRRIQQSFSRLSSGKRVNQAADDAAALAISQLMSAELRSLGQAQRNTQDGISMLQTAEGGMDQMASMLGRMRELAVQASNGTLSDDQRASLDQELSAIREEIDRVSATTEFNSQKLLDGSAASGVKLQVGASAAASDQIELAIEQLDSTTLGDAASTLSSVSLTTETDALDSLAAIDGAIKQVSRARADVGAAQNRLQGTSEELSIVQENLMASRSRLEDTDIAAESSRLIQEQILGNANVAVLGQANKLSASALSLLE